ncbi:iron-containing alcohol dehydrogenase [Thalassotalea sp. LPB0316]|uniref:iron-containing alcohol dehydrogenase n=1 Tax=Thalassotalea sp. LPB0316 TaxID=2769490 RepID=UPI0018660DDF|nr:iron-containing alcohol dehydrogenase [Thalassotalea sp. LPB0316]QOL25322.1 iron-containing alcohol dehydrogenase [Thalassotalea sp. LPB0316]
MFNFTYSNPTRIHFGEQQIAKIAKEIPQSARVLVTYGGGSIKSNGIYQQVEQALSNHTWFEFSGIEPNPSLETLAHAIELVNKEGIDYILAVGGGSVIDGSKFIAAGAHFDGEPWDILAKQAKVTSAIDLGVVLTLPATGSESNSFAVVSKKATNEKLAFGSEHVHPKFAVLDPSVINSLPQKQVTNGIVDAFVHVMEQYLTYPVDAKIQDRFAEGILLTLMADGIKLINDRSDEKARANVMWSATQALNGLIGAGVPQDWATHGIGHQITALYGLDHAQTLAIVLPRMMSVMRAEKQAKLLQYGERVLAITAEQFNGDIDKTIDAIIDKTEQFFASVEMKTRFSQYQLGEDVIEPIIAQLTQLKMTKMGENQTVTLDKVKAILTASL